MTTDEIVIPDNAAEAMGLLWPDDINGEAFTVEVCQGMTISGGTPWVATIYKQRTNTYNGRKLKATKVISLIHDERSGLLDSVTHCLRGEVVGFNATVIEALT